MQIITKDLRYNFVVIGEIEYPLWAVRDVLENINACRSINRSLSQFETFNNIANSLSSINVLRSHKGMHGKIYYYCGEEFDKYYKQLPEKDFEPIISE